MEFVAPDPLTDWVPGQLTVHSPEAGWNRISVRGYRYSASDVQVPALRNYTIVAYPRGRTSMRRRVDGEWVGESSAPRRGVFRSRAR